MLPLFKLQLEAALWRLPCPQPGSTMPRKSLEQVYGRTGCNSISLRGARLATMIALEGTRFRLTQEGSLLFLVQQSCPAAALPGPCMIPTSHALGGAPACGGRCATPGQPWKAARPLDGSGQPWICRAPLLPTPWCRVTRPPKPWAGGRPGCPVVPGSVCHWRPEPQPISDHKTGLISCG